MRKWTIFISMIVVMLSVITGIALQVQATARASEAFLPNAARDEVNVILEDVITTGLVNPVGITNAGDGSGRLFILEKAGRIRVYKDSNLLPGDFLDISAKVNAEGERGLLGLAFHPDYEDNGFLYVFYTRNPDGAITVARFQVSGNPDVADLASEAEVIVVEHPLSNHNAGQLAFGADGKLYIAIGDGGKQGDPDNNAQNPGVLYGKILRIDVDSGNPYSIPADNPFVGQPGKRGEVWVYGLRNPWRFSFDRQTDDLWIGDVGFNNWEEVDYRPAGQSAGANFGWRCKEGTHILNDVDPPCNDPQEVAKMIDPVAEYSHLEGASVTGGYVYRGTTSPDLVGLYFYGDYGSGKIWSLDQSSPGTFAPPQLVIDTEMNISSFGEDELGELYVVDLTGGSVKRLRQENAQIPDMSQTAIRASTNSADPGEIVTYSVRIQNTGSLVTDAFYMADNLPTGVTYQAGTLQATDGIVNDADASILRWEGKLLTSEGITVTYQVKVNQDALGSQITTAKFNGGNYPAFVRKHALQIPRSKLMTTLNDFRLPGSQPGSLEEALSLPESCDVCHTDLIQSKWRGSVMALAGKDPLFWAALEVANHDAPGSGEFCIRCHVYGGWIAGRSSPSDGTALTLDDLESGVGCVICHRAVEPVLSNDDEAAGRDTMIRGAISPPVPGDHVGSAMLVIDPMDFRRGPFPLGIEFGNHPNQTFASDFLGRQQSDYVARSRLCGSCHNVENPALSWDESRQQYWLNESDQPAPEVGSGELFPVETTYDEWLFSEYATTGVVDWRFAGDLPNGRVGACTDCHMPRSTGKAAEDSLNPVFRDCTDGGSGCLPVHEFVGGNSWLPRIVQDERWRLKVAGSGGLLQDTVDSTRAMLAKAADLEATLEEDGGQKTARVKVTNHSGHKLPTGYAEGRRMWINVRAYDANANLVYESGGYDFASGELAQDADLKVYEVLQGITPQLAAELQLPAGESFHFVLNNRVIKDNRIPPRGFSNAAYDRPGLKPVGAVFSDGQYWDEVTYPLPAATSHIIVTLYYQTSSKEYIEFLKLNGGLDSQTLYELWQDDKSPPEIMAQVLTPGKVIYLPVISQDRK